MIYSYPTDLEIITVTGEKSATFLNGQLTNDIKQLANNRGSYNLLLSLKGKVMADLYVIRTEADFKLLTPHPFASLLLAHLNRLAPLSRITLKQETQITPVWHVFADSAEELAKQFGNNLPEPFEWRVGLFRSDRLGKPGVDRIGPPEFSFQNLTAEKVEICRIENGIPKVGVDVTDDHLPQEGRLEAALNFKKGCYLGQEIIARLHYKGHVNRLLSGIAMEGTEIPVPGTAVFVGEKEVGKITSAVLSPALNSPLAFAYLPARGELSEGPFVVGEKKIPARRVELPIKN